MDKLDEFHWHEALDRAALIAAHFEDDVLAHPAIQQTLQLKAKADRISDLLGDLYGAIGHYYPPVVRS